MIGIYTLEKKEGIFNEKTGEWQAGKTIDTYEKRNNISYTRLTDYINNNGNYANSSANAAIWISPQPYQGPWFLNSSTTPTTSIENHIVWRNVTVEAAKYVPATEVDDGYLQFKERFNPPVSERTVRSVGLGQQSVVALDIGYIQGTTDILDVTYRVIIREPDYDNLQGLSPYHAQAIARYFGMYNAGINAVPTSLMVISPHTSQNRQMYTSIFGDDIGTSTSKQFGNWHTCDGVMRFSASYGDINSNNGKLFGQVSTGVEYYPSTYSAKVKPDGVSCVQNVFGKVADANLPYLDIDKQATGTGEITIDDTNGWVYENKGWTAVKYRVRIMSSGATGTSTYRVYKTPWIGTAGETFQNDYKAWTVPSSTAGTTDKGTPESLDGKIYEFHGTNFVNAAGSDSDIGVNNCNFQTYIFPEFLCFNPTGITIGHLSNEYKNIDVYSNISLPVTGLNQVVFEETTGTLYAACAETGLWKIERELEGEVTSITRLTAATAANDGNCHAVQIKKSDGSLWAIFGSELCKSTDSGVTWVAYNSSTNPQFLITGITDTPGEEARIQHMQIDPTHVDDRFAIFYANTTGGDNAGTFVWWSVGGSSVSSDEVFATGSYSATRKSYGGSGVRFSRSGELYIAARYYHPNATVWRKTFIYDWQGTSSKYTTTGYGSANAQPIIGLQPTFLIDENDNEWVIGSTPSQLGETDDSYIWKYPTGPFDPNSPVRIGRNHNATSYDSAFVYTVLVLKEGLFLTSYRSLTSAFGGDPTHWTLKAQHYQSYGSNPDLSIESGMAESYGWNGSSWEKDHAGNRPTHDTREPLIDGMSVTFSGALSDAFITTEYYEAYVYDGVMKDNATTTSFSTTLTGFLIKETSSTDVSTVPISNRGLVSNTPTSVIRWGQWRWASVQGNYNVPHSNSTFYGPDVSTDPVYNERGNIHVYCSGSNGYTTANICEEKLSGDFVVSFKLAVPGYDNSLESSLDFLFGVRSWNNDLALYPSAEPEIEEILSLYRDRNEPYGSARIGIRNPVTTTFIQSYDMTDWDPQNDVFTVSRTGTTITYSRNGTPFYVSSAVSTNDCQFHVSGAYAANFRSGVVLDATCTYTDNRRLVRIGSSAQATGHYDPDLRKVLTSSWIRDKYNSVTLDGAPCPINYEGETPAPGEVTLLPGSAQLWFHEDDAGKTIACNFGYVEKLNRTDPGPTGIQLNEFIVRVENGLFYIDDVAIPTLTLEQGKEYYFRQEDATNVGNEFNISIYQDGVHTEAGSPANAGVKDVSIVGSEGSVGGYTLYRVPEGGTPPTVYYYSEQTPNFGGQINIIAPV